jgi:phosphate uptake regulator
MYGSEITGMFKTSSAACRKETEYLLQQIYINDCIIDKSHFKYLKYILGVNKKSTNLAVIG